MTHLTHPQLLQSVLQLLNDEGSDGFAPDGKRHILGASVALSEAEVHWCEFLQSLQQRGLRGLQLLVSDDHAGLTAARRAVFPSVPWQRCQFHLQQNAQAYAPRPELRTRVSTETARIVPLIFLADDLSYAPDSSSNASSRSHSELAT